MGGFTFRTRVKPEWIADGAGTVYGGDTSWTSAVRDVVGEGTLKASVNSDSPGILYVEGAIDPAGPWINLFAMATILDAASGLYVADISIPVAGRRYVRVYFDSAPNPIGVNFDISAYMIPL